MTRKAFKRRRPENENWEVAPGITCVKLTRGKFALIDTKNWDKISTYRWHAYRNVKIWYAVSSVILADGRKGTLWMHRIVLDAPGQFDVDHINGNGLDNSSLFGPLNIRLSTTRVNCQNRHDSRTSKYPGVHWDSCNRRWRAKIQLSGRRIYLGSFTDELEAASAYMRACPKNDALLMNTCESNKSVSYLNT